MSTGEKIPWEQARAIVQRLLRDLNPVVKRCIPAGSFRRHRPQVGDIEIVVEPRQTTDGLFAREIPDLEIIQAVASRWSANGRLHRAGDRQVAVILPEGVKVELYLVHPPAQWGSILAIRTGPAELGTWVMKRLKARGLAHRQGHIEQVATGEWIPTLTEEEFFAAAGLPCLPPSERDTRAAFRSLPQEAHRG